jgi:hypothetical protein
VNLMDAFRQSAEASGASTASKPKADAPARRTAHEKTEYRDRHYGREGRWLTKSGVGATH